MSLGTNRDYKRRTRLAFARLAQHDARMKELIEQGMNRVDASAQAYDEMQRSKTDKEKSNAVQKR